MNILIICCFLLIGHSISYSMKIEYVNLNQSNLNKEADREKAVNNFLPYFPLVKGLSLAKNNLCKNDFDTLTQQLNPNKETFAKLILLDLTGNNLTPSTALSLSHWLDLPSLQYVNIIGNAEIALKKIESLYHALKNLPGVGQKISEFMKKIIFMTSGYVKKANQSVQVYQTLKKQKIIPDDWAKRHLDFYKSDICKSMNRQKKHADYERFQQLIKSFKNLSLQNDSLEKDISLSESENSDSNDNISPFESSSRSNSSSSSPSYSAHSSPRSTDSDYEERVDLQSLIEYNLEHNS